MKNGWRFASQTSSAGASPSQSNVSRRQLIGRISDSEDLLLHFDLGAFLDELGEDEGVPVREADAAVAFVAANLIGRGGAVHADAGAVDGDPDDADGVVRAGGRLKAFSLRTPLSKTDLSQRK